MARVLEGEDRFGSTARSAGSSGSSIALAGVGPTQEMGWKTYAGGDAASSTWSGMLVGLRAPAPAGRPAAQSRRVWRPSSPDSSFNTAVSFATNTNWQGYGGETTMSYLTQMLGLTVQNFVSAATGMAVLVALIRGFARRTAADHRQLLGRPHADHALHPAAAVASSSRWCSSRRAWSRPSALREGAVVSPRTTSRHRQGRQAVLTTRAAKTEVTLTEQVIAVGRPPRRSPSSSSAPTAAASSTSTRRIPFENPTPLSNFLEMLVDPR